MINMTDHEYAAVLYREIFHVEDDNGDAYTRGIMDILSTLDMREQKALECHYRLGYSYEKTGKVMGDLEGQTARQIVFRALRKLRHPSIIKNASVTVTVNSQAEQLQEANAVIEKLYDQIDQLIQGGPVTPIIKEGIESRKMTIVEIGVSKRVHRLLTEAGISTVESLLALKNLEGLMKINNFGQGARDELILKMRDHGFSGWADRMSRG